MGGNVCPAARLWTLPSAIALLLCGHGVNLGAWLDWSQRKGAIARHFHDD